MIVSQNPVARIDRGKYIMFFAHTKEEYAWTGGF